MSLLNQLLDGTYKAFTEQFGGQPEAVVLAPGRVNLIGEHTDYSEGFVLPMAINRHVAVAFRSREGRSVRIWSEHAGEHVEIPLDGLQPGFGRGWIRYAGGMVWVLQHRGVDLPGSEIVVTSSLPVGAGVSSSAAFEVGLGAALAASAGAETSPVEIAVAAHKSDNEFVGIPSGIMDQFAVACCTAGHAILLDCRDLSFEQVPLDPDARFVVIDTGKRRRLVEGAYAERVASCRTAVEALQTRYPDMRTLRDSSMAQLDSVTDRMDEKTFRRARHVISENERPERFVTAMQKGDLAAAGSLMDASHRSLAQDYEVSCRELEDAVGAGRDHPACYGARLTGAGFGGCAIALCRKTETEAFVAHLESTFVPGYPGSSVYPVEASEGVRILS